MFRSHACVVPEQYSVVDPFRREQDGAALVLVLVVLSVVGIGLGAMLAEADANLVTSTVVRGHDNKVYAADGGVEYGIRQLRAVSSLCAAPTSPPSPATPLLPDPTIDGIPVHVTCQATAGLATSVSPWALVTTDPNPNSLNTANGTEMISGPTYVNGQPNLGTPLQMINGGSFLQHSGCGAAPGNLSPAGAWHCTTSPVPDPAPTLPAARPAGRAATPAFVFNGCSLWQPGTYTGINLGAHNYFASGVYYFEDTAVAFNGSTAVGGQPGTDTAQPSSGCSGVTDKTAGVDNGSGVEFILGGSSTISVGPGSQVELFTRVPGPSGEGTPGLSVRTVGPSASPFKPTSSGHPVVASTSAGSQLFVHGLVYAPDGSVTLNSSNPSGAAVLGGGLLCWDVTLQASSSGNGAGALEISLQSSPGQPRYVIVTSTTTGAVGDKVITSTAVVAIGNDAQRTVTVQSWITNNT